MDLRGLEAVIAIHKHGSFSSAADQMYISQPALTRRVALLEQELGVKLFVRTSRGVHLTEAGEALIEPMRRALHETSAIRDTIHLLRTGARGSLGIVGKTDLTRSSLGELVGRFHDTFPHVEVRTASAESDDAALAAVASSAFDLAVVELPVADDEIDVSFMGAEELLIVLGPADHAGRIGGGPLPLTKELVRGRTLVHLPSTKTKQRAPGVFAGLGETPASQLEVSSCELITPIMRWTRSIAVLPRQDALDAQAEGLTLATAPYPLIRRVGLARRKGTAEPATRRFLQLATQLAGGA